MLPFLCVLIISTGLLSPSEGKISVTIEGIKETKGTMVIALFDNRGDFNVNPVKYLRKKVTGNDPISVVFTEIPFKEYAISVYQDTNDNGKLDKNFLGIPIEPYGFSNNPVIRTGPSYERSAFRLDTTELSMNIRLR